MSERKTRRRFDRSILKRPPQRKRAVKPPAPVGRPTSYEGELTCQRAREYFFQEVDVRLPMLQAFPTLVGFAHVLGVHYDTVCEWRKVHKEFSDTIKACQQYQKHLLITNSLAGRYDKTFAIFMFKNLCKWMDVQKDDNWRDDLHHDHGLDGQSLTEFLNGMMERAEQINPRQPKEGQQP